MIKIKELRKDKKLTQNDIALAINTSQSNIARWEKMINEPTASQIIKLADFFKVSIDYLLNREDDTGNITVSAGQLTDQLPNDEQRLLYTYRKLDKIDKDKIIDIAEHFTRRCSQSSNSKNRN